MRTLLRLLFLCFLASSAAVAQGVSYSYDSLGRIVGVVNQNGSGAQYTYDANGNILSIQQFTSSQVVILSFSPASGPVGAAVTISGANFGGQASQNTVSFNGTQASIVSASATQIVATVPASATSGPISVTAPLGSATSSGTFTVIAAGAEGGPPSITGISPNVANAGGQVTLSGTNFDPSPPNDLVTVNNFVTSVNSVASTEALTFAVPNAGSGPVTLLTPYGSTTGPILYIPPAPYTASQVSIAQALTLGNPTNVSIPAAGDIAMLSFSGTAGQVINVWALNSTFPGDPAVNLSILNPDGSTLAFAQVVTTGNGGLPFVTLPSAGTYTVVVAAQSGGGSATILLSGEQTGTLTMGTADPVTINTPGQNVVLSFSGTAGQEINLWALNSTFPGDPAVDLSILNPDGSTLALTQLSGQDVGLTFVTLPTTGTYSVIFSPQNGGTGSASVIMSDELTGTLTIDTADPITINTPGQNAILSFSGTAGQELNLWALDSTFPGCDSAIVTILNPDLSTLASTDLCGQNNVGLSFLDLPTTGTYYVILAPQNAITGSVTLTLSDEVTGALTIDTADPITINAAGQNGVLTFSGAAGEVVNVWAVNSTFPGGCYSLNLSVFNPDGSLLASTNLCGQGNVGLSFLDLPTAGTYTVVLTPQNGGTGSASIVVSDEQTGSLTMDTAYPITINAAGQNAFLTFSGTAGEWVNLWALNSTFPGCNSLNLSVFNSDGSLLASTNLCGQGNAGLPFLDLPATGTYYVILTPQNAGTGSTTLMLSTEQTGSLTIDTADPVTLDVAGENAFLTFSGTAGALMNVWAVSSTFPGNCYSLNLSVFNPDGSLLGSNNLCGQGNVGLPFLTLPTTGTYTVVLTPQNGGTGSVSVTVSDEPIGSLTIGTADPLTIDVAGQTAFLAFSGTAGQILNLEAASSTFPGDCYSLILGVFNPDGSVLAYNSFCGQGSFSINNITLPTTGTYTVGIEPENAGTGSTTITLATP